MSAKKDVVVITREWHNPQIRVVVTSDAIGISMALDDFVKALALEIGNPTSMLTQAQLMKRLTAAKDQVLRGMKQVTAKVM